MFCATFNKIKWSHNLSSQLFIGNLIASLFLAKTLSHGSCMMLIPAEWIICLPRHNRKHAAHQLKDSPRNIFIFFLDFYHFFQTVATLHQKPGLWSSKTFLWPLIEWIGLEILLTLQLRSQKPKHLIKGTKFYKY